MTRTEESEERARAFERERTELREHMDALEKSLREEGRHYIVADDHGRDGGAVPDEGFVTPSQIESELNKRLELAGVAFRTKVRLSHTDPGRLDVDLVHPEARIRILQIG